MSRRHDDDRGIYGLPGDVSPWDVRFDAGDRAFLDAEGEGRFRLRVWTEPALGSARPGGADGPAGGLACHDGGRGERALHLLGDGRRAVRRRLAVLVRVPRGRRPRPGRLPVAGRHHRRHRAARPLAVPGSGRRGDGAARGARLGARRGDLPDLPRPLRKRRPLDRSAGRAAVGDGAAGTRVLGRRPGGDRLSPGLLGAAGGGGALPHADLRLALQPPLRHGRLPDRRPAAGRQRGAARDGGRGARGRDPGGAGRVHQPRPPPLLRLRRPGAERAPLGVPRLVRDRRSGRRASATART